jgi:hypothetical protein
MSEVHLVRISTCGFLKSCGCVVKVLISSAPRGATHPSRPLAKDGISSHFSRTAITDSQLPTRRNSVRVQHQEVCPCGRIQSSRSANPLPDKEKESHKISPLSLRQQVSLNSNTLPLPSRRSQKFAKIIERKVLPPQPRPNQIASRPEHSSLRPVAAS